MDECVSKAININHLRVLIVTDSLQQLILFASLCAYWCVGVRWIRKLLSFTSLLMFLTIASFSLSFHSRHFFMTWSTLTAKISFYTHISSLECPWKKKLCKISMNSCDKRNFLIFKLNHETFYFDLKNFF